MSAMTDMAAENRLLAGGLGSLPRVNLLPPEIAEAVVFRRIQAGLVGAVVLAAVSVGLVYSGANGAVSDAQKSVDAASVEQTTLLGDMAQYKDVTAVYAEAAAAEVTLTQAMGEEVRYSRLLNDLSLSIPENVWVNNLTFSQVPGTAAAGATSSAIGTVTLTGVAFEHDDVAVWLESLAKQKGYGDPYLQSSTAALLGERLVVNWSTTVNLTPAALSGRYTAGS